MKPIINNLFSIGYRCTSDELIKKLGQRYYSSPFSYMACDLETALFYITNKFIGFRDVIRVLRPHRYTFNNIKWGDRLFFNKNFISESNNASDWKRILAWNHHDMSNPDDISASIRRENHLLSSLAVDETTLLVHVGNIELFDGVNFTFYKQDFIVDFLKTHPSVHFLILVPIVEFQEEPLLLQKERLDVIFYNSNYEGDGNDIANAKIPWPRIIELINNIYDFRIV